MQKILGGQDFARIKNTRQEKINPLLDRRRRLIFISCLLFAWIFLAISRLVQLQITSHEHWGKWALRQHLTNITVNSERGPIYDRRGKLLAVSVPANSIYIRPRSIPAGQREAVKWALSKSLNIEPGVILTSMASRQPFVWIKRQANPEEAQKVADLNLPGVGSMMEARRYYPYNSSASTLIGRVSIDGNGLSGIERAFEKKLSAPDIKESMSKDAMGNLIESAEASEGGSMTPPKGQPIYLTLDAELQAIVDEEVARGHKSANAKAVLAVLAEASSGEILALSQSPSPNFNTASDISPLALRNLVAEMVLEPGSIMKPLVTAAALNEKVTNQEEKFDCQMGRYKVGKHTIKDVHPSGVISVRDIVVRSSNIGMTKIGMRLGKERLYDYLHRFGFGEASGLNLPGETDGILRHHSKWALVDVATHSFGQGVAVTPLRMVRAVAAVVNEGLRPELRIVKSDEPGKFTRILNADVANKLRDTMFAVVEDEHGTGGNAKIAPETGFRVGGKTGTAQKARAGGRGYQSGKYASSFLGFAVPQTEGEFAIKANPDRPLPNYVLLVTVDEPKANSIYGGVLAAPVFQKILTRAIELEKRRG